TVTNAADGKAVVVAPDDGKLRVDAYCCTAALDAVEPRPENFVWTTEGMLQALDTGNDSVGRRCIVILEPGTGLLHIGCGASDVRGAMTEIPAAAFLGSVTTTGWIEPEAADVAGEPNPLLLEDPEVESRTQRFVMTTVAAPLPADGETAWRPQGPIVILGENPRARALHKRLQPLGVPVHLLAGADLEETRAALEQIWALGPAPHLFLMTGHADEDDPLHDPVDWRRTTEQQALIPFFVCQRWLQLAHDHQCVDQCSVVAVTHLGGDFGFGSHIRVPHGGAMTGLMKALCLEYFVLREHQGFRAKAIDAPESEDPDQLAECICIELASGSLDYEVAYVDGQRFLQLAILEKTARQDGPPIQRGGTWVVTGGARGITAESARELGRRFGLKLHLIGRSPAPNVPAARRSLDAASLAQWRSEIMIAAREQGVKPNEAWELVEKSIEIDRTLREFAAAGIRAEYHTCDVGDREALAAVLDEIRQTDGPIDGILHGAGIERPCRFEKKTSDSVRATFAAKVDGAYHLMTLTQQDPIRHFIAYGSISGRLGSNGQTDYCAASDMLCKLAAWYHQQRPECRTIAFHWHPWDEVGMASRPATRASLERTNGPALMPKREGLQHLLNELSLPQRRCEVLITDWEFHQRYYPAPTESGSASAGAPSPREHDAAANGFPAADAAIDRIADRHVMRLEETPLTNDAAVVLPKSALILGNNPAAFALLDRLIAVGVTAHVLPADDAETSLRDLEQIWRTNPARALFVMTGREFNTAPLVQINKTGHVERAERSVLLPYRVTQRWMQLVDQQGWSEPAFVVAATNLGGAFGLEGQVPEPLNGALCGLMKSIHVENVRHDARNIVVKVIDAPVDEPLDDLAESIDREVTSGAPEVEVAWSGGRRRIVRCCRETLRDDHRVSPRRGGVWVVTGGARGITAAAALDLGRKHGLRLRLIGRSPAPYANAPWRHATHAELKLLKRKIVMQAVSEGRSPEEDW
ncbi:MAG: SDR family NAD(P)-dependent oxidoreductase, partial [Planctomycetaceae bacterium]|nr:SDR family NAD(P)-dependent oxidoreductase [Planctomycetaceae bacterium]